MKYILNIFSKKFQELQHKISLKIMIDKMIIAETVFTTETVSKFDYFETVSLALSVDDILRRILGLESCLADLGEVDGGLGTVGCSCNAWVDCGED